MTADTDGLIDFEQLTAQPSIVPARRLEHLGQVLTTVVFIFWGPVKTCDCRSCMLVMVLSDRLVHLDDMRISHTPDFHYWHKP